MLLHPLRSAGVRGTHTDVRFFNGGGMPRRVLVVDDSHHVRKLLAWHIEKATGLELCGEAVDGAQGVDLAVEMRPDVIILDQEMPVWTGLARWRSCARPFRKP